MNIIHMNVYGIISSGHKHIFLSACNTEHTEKMTYCTEIENGRTGNSGFCMPLYIYMMAMKIAEIRTMLRTCRMIWLRIEYHYCLVNCEFNGNAIDHKLKCVIAFFIDIIFS